MTPMNCEELRDSFELYALGVLESPERREIKAHLARGCKACESSLREAIALNSLVLASTPQTAPPARLKRRVLASFGFERAGWGWLGAFAAVLLLMVALWLSVQERRRANELAEARRQAIQISAERDRLTQALGIVNQPETRRASFGAGQTGQPRGNIFVNPRLGVLLIASDLPALPAGRMYEMWIIQEKNSAPRPAGLFQPAAEGGAMHLLTGAVDSMYAVAVSIEPDSGSSAPTTKPVIVAAVPGA